MAAITVNTRQDSVFGDRRVILADVSIAADVDTFATGLSTIEYVGCTSPTNQAIGATISGGTITFQIGGSAENNARLTVVGV